MSTSDAEFYIGKTYGELKILGINPVRNKGNGMIRFDCVCSCGTLKTLPRQTVLSGKTKSCGHLLEQRRKLRQPDPPPIVVPPKEEPKIEMDVTLGLVAKMDTIVKPLTMRQQAVIQEYFLNNGDDKAAYYKFFKMNKSGASEQKRRAFFKDPRVLKFIEDEKNRRFEVYKVDGDKAMQELGYIAFYNPKDYFNVYPKLDENGEKVKDERGKTVMVVEWKQMNDLTREQAAAISKVVLIEDGKYKYEFWNKPEAARLIAESSGKFPKKTEFTGRFVLETTDVTKLSNDKLKAIARDPRVALPGGFSNN